MILNIEWIGSHTHHTTQCLQFKYCTVYCNYSIKINLRRVGITVLIYCTSSYWDLNLIKTVDAIILICMRNKNYFEISYIQVLYNKGLMETEGHEFSE